VDRRRRAELLVAVVSAAAASALLWWLLAEQSASPILGRVGGAEGDVRDASAATDRISLMDTPATEPVARLAPGAALHWSWTEPAAVRSVWIEARGSDRYEVVLEPAGGPPIVREWGSGDARAYVRETIDVDAPLVGITVRAMGAELHRLSEVSVVPSADRRRPWGPLFTTLLAAPALFVATRRRFTLTAVLAIGVAWRVVTMLMREPFLRLDGDAVGYLARGAALFTDAPGDALWPPGTHIFYGLLRAIDPSWNALLVAQVVLSCAVPLLAARIAQRVGGATTAALTACVLSLWWPLVGLTARLWSQTLFTFLLVAATAIALAGRSVVAGVALGAAIATRTEALLLASVPFLVLARTRPRAAARAALGVLVVLVPTSLRASAITGHWTLVATNPALHVATAWSSRVSSERLQRADASFAIAWNVVRERPLWALGEAARSAGRAFTDGSPNTWAWAAIAIAAIAAVGAIRDRRRALLLWPLAAALLVCAVSVGASRYRVPTDPFTVALAVATLVGAWRARLPRDH
jgi:hypothetical protein